MRSLTCPECGNDTKSLMGDFDWNSNRIRKRGCDCGFIGVSVEAWVPENILFSEIAVEYRARHRENARKRRGSRGTQRGKRWYAMLVKVERVAVAESDVELDDGQADRGGSRQKYLASR